jgi:hypothetical protein
MGDFSSGPDTGQYALTEVLVDDARVRRWMGMDRRSVDFQG